MSTPEHSSVPGPSNATPATSPRRVVVALGGNAITRPGADDSVAQDYINLERSLDSIVHMIEQGYEVIMTHGNGPQVGNQMIRVELSLTQAPNLPLDVMVADLQGGLGYMIERVLRNKFHRAGLERSICVLLTMVEVSAEDPAFQNPTKFVGPAFPESEVAELQTQRGWLMKEDKGRGWRRVVPSPEPIGIVEKGLIRHIAEQGTLAIVAGGGGIPVHRDAEGEVQGVEGVIDKDFASAVVARETGAQELYILTAVEQVKLHFGTPEERALDRITAAEARRFMDEGHFPAGSMGPKMEAAVRFVEEGGQRSLITDVFTLDKALAGETGTWIVP